MSRFPRAREVAIVVVSYTLLGLAVTWPLARDFTTRFLGDVSFDQRHSVWLMWQVKEAFLGRQPWFSGAFLYYPHGIPTLVDGVGPLNGILALPFWPWGPMAAYNGATLLGFVLSGCGMYLLARCVRPVTPAHGHGQGRPEPDDSAGHAGSASAAAHAGAAADGAPSAFTGLRGLDATGAFFAGILYMMWPFHVASLYGHVEKVSTGLLPLSVLAGYYAYDPARGRRWLAAPGVILLLSLMHNGNQFMFAVTAIVLLFGICLWTTPRDVWHPLVTRAALAAVLSLVIVGPYLAMVARVAFDPKLEVKIAAVAPYYSPDVLQFFVPSIHQATVGRLFYPAYDTELFDFARASVIPALMPEKGWQGSTIETAVTIPFVALVLMAIAWLWRWPGARAARMWGLFGAVFVLLALGPGLRFVGRTTFTLYQLPVMLPFAALAHVPGYSVLRTPGRFMMMGSVAFALVAALGLAALLARVARTPHRAHLVTGFAIGLVLIECWPRTWKQQVPLPVPEFYRQLAQDRESYAVLDLPSGRWRPDLASGFMFYQMTHDKPIAWGYLSRQFFKYPVEGVDGILDGQAPNGAATRARLLQLGYRFVVWHKRHAEVFGVRTPETVGDGRFRGEPADARTNPFIRDAFGDEPPIVDDEMVTVYRLDRR